MRVQRRVEAMLEIQLYEEWQEYLKYHRRTSQAEIRWLIQHACNEMYAERARARQQLQNEVEDDFITKEVV
jgi:hypothetical protein